MSSINAPGDLKPALPTAKTSPGSGLRRMLQKGNFRDYGLLIALAVIMLFFEVKTDGVLFEPLNLTNLILQNSYVVVMALGMLLIIVAGHIDLSIGSVVGFVGALAAVLMVQGLHLGLGFIGLDAVGVDIPPLNYGWQPSSASSSAVLSALRRVIGSPISRSRASSSRWPACWCSAA